MQPVGRPVVRSIRNVNAGELIGSGSEGMVYEGRLKGIHVAVKVRRICCATHTRDELISSMVLAHPNLVRTHLALQRQVIQQSMQGELVDENGCWNFGDEPEYGQARSIDLGHRSRDQSAVHSIRASSTRCTSNDRVDGELFECFLVQVRPVCHPAELLGTLHCVNS